jgi:hypothetical protein
MTQKDFAERLGMLGFPMLERDAGHTANETLADIAKDEDLRLWEGFPVALATALEKGWFNYREVMKHLPSTEAAARFHALLAMALAVWNAAGLKLPSADQIEKQLKPEQENSWHHFYEALRNKEDFTLLGRTMSGDRVLNTFERYHGEAAREAVEENWRTAFLSVREQHDLRFALSQIFSPRQKELVLKRMRGEKFTKTEREYYSRAVKKKLTALANQELHRLALALRS